MSVGSWNPEGEQPAPTVAETQLAQLANLTRQNTIEDLAKWLSQEDQQWLASTMPVEGLDWQAAANNLSDDDLVVLIRFFTLAEMKVPGCTAGISSPVISLNKLLKARGSKLDKETLQWIKANSDNRFLPNGPIL